MATYLARRLSMMLLTLSLVAVTVFVLVRLVPGDSATLMLGEAGSP